jgi:DNA-binding winged helix-turn-helix (wHTH) protein
VSVSVTWVFDAFSLDQHSRRLSRNGEPVAISETQARLLLTLVSQAGTVVSKEHLVCAGWGDIAVTDNSVEKAIWALRRALGGDRGDRPYIETVSRFGYRFVGVVRREVARESLATIEALLRPHRVWLEGRTALETLEVAPTHAAYEAFYQLLRTNPDDLGAHIGVAHACAFRYEATRARVIPDIAALTEGRRHAEDACRLDPNSGDAWAALALVQSCGGHTADALVAARRAVALEPANWRHALRFAVASWGDVRMRAAESARRLLPGLGLAHWLAATVHVARQAFEAARRELTAGIAAQAATPDHGRRFDAIGLQWLLGLIRCADGDCEGARRALERELSDDVTDHLYARECRANAWYALGAICARDGARAEAMRAFTQASLCVEGHLPALVGQAVVATGADRLSCDRALRHRLERSTDAPMSVDRVLAQAIVRAWNGAPDVAAAMILDALTHQPPGAAGWILPVEPMLGVSALPTVWAPVLALLRARAA